MSRGRLTAQRLLRTTADRCAVIHVAANQVRAHNENGATLEERHNYYQEDTLQRMLRSIADMEYAASQERPVLTRNEMDQVFDELRQYRWAMEPGAAERLRSGFRRTYFVREGQLQSQVET